MVLPMEGKIQHPTTMGDKLKDLLVNILDREGSISNPK